MRILLHPDPALRKKARPVTEFNSELAATARRMLDLMREHAGVGLAAPQVGVPLRVFVCNPTGDPKDDLVVINPRFVELNGSEEREEGCLSLPGVNVTMRRAAKAVIEAYDLAGTRFERSAEDLEARVWQHEADHLDGRLIIDAMSSTDAIANRRALKQL
jgi:peptide deformylase